MATEAKVDGCQDDFLNKDINNDNGCTGGMLLARLVPSISGNEYFTKNAFKKKANENTDGDASDLFIYFLKQRHICRKGIPSGLAKINQINETTFKREHFRSFHIFVCAYFRIFVL